MYCRRSGVYTARVGPLCPARKPATAFRSRAVNRGSATLTSSADVLGDVVVVIVTSEDQAGPGSRASSPDNQ